MDMFQAPPLLEDPFNNVSVLHKAEESELLGYPRNGKYDKNRGGHLLLYYLLFTVLNGIGI